MTLRASKQADPTYKVFVQWTKSGDTTSGSGNPVVVEAYTPEQELSLDFSAVWSAPFTDVGNIASSGINRLGSMLTGIAITDPRLTALIWKGMGTPSIVLDLEFFAEENSREDVLVPMVNLAKMVLPEQKGLLVVAPGPNIGSQAVASITDFIGLTNRGNTGSRQIGERLSISIGKTLVFPLVVMERVTISLPLYKADANGRYIHGKAKIQAKPFKAPFRGDLDQMFGMNL